MFRGGPGAFPGALRWIPFEVKSLHVQILVLWDRIIIFLSRPRGGHLEPPCPPGVPDKNESGIWHPRDLKPSPLNAGQVL